MAYNLGPTTSVTLHKHFSVVDQTLDHDNNSRCEIKLEPMHYDDPRPYALDKVPIR